MDRKFLYKMVIQLNGKWVTVLADSEKEFTEKIMKYGYKPTGKKSPSGKTRECLWDQPKYNGLIGPMYDGKDGDREVIRYECQETYDTLSK